MDDVVLRPLSKGEILDAAFTLLRRNFVAFVGCTAVFVVPATVIGRVQPEVGVIASLVATFCAYGATVRVASDAAMGRTPSIGSACSTGIRKFLPVLVNYVVLLVLMFLGFFLVVVGMFIVAMMGFAITQVVVLEGRWIAFGRSRVLAKKSWGKISVLLLLSWIITALPTIALLGAATLLSTSSRNLLVDPQAPTSLWVNVTAGLLACFTTPFSQCVLTLLYYDQRVRKEGLGIELQAAALAPSAPSAG